MTHTTNINFKNTTIFFIPLKLNNKSDKEDKEIFRNQTEIINNCPDWKLIPKNELISGYIMPYFTNLLPNENKQGLLYTYRYKNIDESKNIFFYNSDDKVKISDIVLSVFGTCTGFLEYRVEYDDSCSVEYIEDFAYNFKKSVPSSRACNNKTSLFNFSKNILPAGIDAELFFDKPRGDKFRFKYECCCFHIIRLPEKEYNINYINKHMSLLGRTYKSSFDRPVPDQFDMTFSPYPYMHWSGSQDSLASVCFEPNPEQSYSYINTHYYNTQLTDYRFFYLNLLNQRYAGIDYITRIAQSETKSSEDLEKLNKLITNLKTTYSFRIASTDMLLQNIYKKMYDILEIDFILSDIRDNEDQMSVIKTISTEKYQRLTNLVLTIISFLSLFSILIDSSSFLDRFGIMLNLSSVISIVIVVLALIFSIYLYRKRSKK